jgi:hypothetical protein
MFSLSRKQLLNLALASTLVALTSSTAAHSDEMAVNLGPVGPQSPFSRPLAASASSPSMRRTVVTALSTPWFGTTETPAQRPAFGLASTPGKWCIIDSVEHQSINLQCGDNAETLAVVDNAELVAFGTTE